MEKEERENTERRELATKKEPSWELIRICRYYIKENGKKWKEEKGGEMYRLED